MALDSYTAGAYTLSGTLNYKMTSEAKMIEMCMHPFLTVLSARFYIFRNLVTILEAF